MKKNQIICNLGQVEVCSQHPKTSEQNSCVAIEGVLMALSLFSKVEGAVLSTMLICFFQIGSTCDILLLETKCWFSSLKRRATKVLP